MKNETNNQIDLLLRRISRRDGNSVNEREAQTDARHLDVDEVSSYAQNALPAVARARYTEHLAECSSCRRLVTELSLSLGVAAAARVEAVSERTGLKKFLASLFSPMVLRYAGPALGVIVIVVVGFVVLRQQARDAFVAQLEKRQPIAQDQTTAPMPEEALNDNVSPDAPHRQERAATPGTQPTPESKAPADKSAVAAADTAKDKAVATTAQPETEIAAAAPAAVAPAASPKTGQSDTADLQKLEPAAAKKQAESVAAKQAPQPQVTATANEASRDTRSTDKTAERAGPAGSKTGTVDSRGAFATGRTAASRSRAEEDKGEVETRSVAGRRFRKERGVWIDTAYDSSTATVNMARGSEQFRALVADEPSIGTIAKQLDGEVIVVWKGRAYRIR